MKAEVTYNGGASYRIKKFVFKNGITQVIGDSEVITHLSQTVGFAVRILEREKKKIRQVVESKPAKKSSIPTGAEEIAIEASLKARKDPSSVTGKKKRKV